MTLPSITMLAVLECGRHHPDSTIRQYARNFQAICAWRGLDREKLAADPADLKTYLGYAPKYDKHDGKLLRELTWNRATYQQYQRGGRLLIEHVTGSLAQRRVRQAVEDDRWADLRRAAESLMRAKLLSPKRLASLIRIEDLARAEGLQPPDLTNERVVALKARTHDEKEWDRVKRGAAALDDLRLFPTLASYLPPKPIGPIDTRWRRSFTVPPHLENELSAWLKEATTIYPDEAATATVREALATPQSDGSRGIFQAAHRNYLSTLGEEKAISCVNTLAGCFGEDDALAVLQRWVSAMGKPGALKARSMAAYMDCIRLTLERNGQPEKAAVFAMLLRNHAVLKEGVAAGKRMSPQTERWCRALLKDPKKVELFETQHALYAVRAKAALDDAETEALDLVELAADKKKLAALPKKRRSLAKRLLKRARRFGTAAAFTAIELEGAPLREGNVLELDMSGPRATFFDHSEDKDPHFLIVIPNELLKNGKELTERGQELPPIFIRKLKSDDVGLEILRFYIDRIRPLFPRSRTSTLLFPGLEGATPHLDPRTWSRWLSDCSTEIGLQLTSHNFRHGRCSIEINDDPNCIEELAVVLGDQPATLKKYYAFLDKDKQIKTLQGKVAERRARYRAGQALTGSLA